MENTTIEVNDSVVGETIEMKMERVVNNNEPITDGAPIVYTERKDGVKPEYDIRTDRFEIAVEAMDKVEKTYKAQREERMKPVKDEPKTGEGNATEGAADSGTSN